MKKENTGKLALIKGAVEGIYTVKEVARQLNLCERRVKQLKKAYREQGKITTIHGNTGRRPPNYIDDKLRTKIISLKKSSLYNETNFSHFKELLAEREGIKISYSALLLILKSAGITSKRKHRLGSSRFMKLGRIRLFGEKKQTDTSSSDWFGDGKRYALHEIIDNAKWRIFQDAFVLGEARGVLR
jgi:transposase